METKKMRQMAYKKKLEEEYREFQERCKVRPRWMVVGGMGTGYHDGCI